MSIDGVGEDMSDIEASDLETLSADLGIVPRRHKSKSIESYTIKILPT